MTAPRPIKSPPARLRQRQRADGAWRVWWEPETPLRELGFEPVVLDAGRLTWSVREAERLNGLVDQARGKPAPGAATAARRGKTVSALIRAYRESPGYRDTLRPATRKDYDQAFRTIEAKWGGKLVADFTTAILREWYEALYAARGAHSARALLRKFSILMGYGKLRGWRTDNPAHDLRLLTPPRRARVASWAEIDALMAAARAEGLPSMELAIALAVFQGQRQTDVRAAETAAFARMIWTLRRSKRQNVGAMRIHPEVQPLLAAMLAVAGGRQLLLHYEGTAGSPCDMPYSENLFCHVFARVRARAAEAQPALAGLKFRDLRRTFGHLARLGGADPRDVGDALGNQAGFDPELGEIYMPPSFETASRAVAAVEPPKGWRNG